MVARVVEQNLGQIHGITLPDINQWQLIAQYMDDIGLTVKAQESNIHNTISLYNILEEL